MSGHEESHPYIKDVTESMHINILVYLKDDFLKISIDY